VRRAIILSARKRCYFVLRAHIISANLQARFSCVRYVHRKFRSRCYTVRKMRPGVLPLGRYCVKPIRRNPAQKPRLQSVTDGSLLMPVTPRQEYTEVKQVHERCASSTYCRVKVPPALEVSSSSSSDYFHRASSYCEPDQRVLSRCFPTPIAHGVKRSVSSINATGFLMSLLSRALFDSFAIINFIEHGETCLVE